MIINASRVNLQVREDKLLGVFIKDVTEVYVSEEREVLDLWQTTSKNRATAYTKVS